VVAVVFCLYCLQVVVDYYGNEFTLSGIINAFASGQGMGGAEAMPASNATLADGS